MMYVLSASCTYYYRLGEMCSHVATLLVEACVSWVLLVPHALLYLVFGIKLFQKGVILLHKYIVLVHYCHADITSSSEPNSF